MDVDTTAHFGAWNGPAAINPATYFTTGGGMGMGMDCAGEAAAAPDFSALMEMPMEMLPRHNPHHDHAGLVHEAFVGFDHAAAATDDGHGHSGHQHRCPSHGGHGGSTAHGFESLWDTMDTLDSDMGLDLGDAGDDTAAAAAGDLHQAVMAAFVRCAAPCAASIPAAAAAATKPKPEFGSDDGGGDAWPAARAPCRGAMQLAGCALARLTLKASALAAAAATFTDHDFDAERACINCLAPQTEREELRYMNRNRGNHMAPVGIICSKCHRKQPDRVETWSEVPRGMLPTAADGIRTFEDMRAYLRRVGAADIQKYNNFKRRYLHEQGTGRVCVIVGRQVLSCLQHKRLINYKHLASVIVIHPTRPELAAAFYAQPPPARGSGGPRDPRLERCCHFGRCAHGSGGSEC